VRAAGMYLVIAVLLAVVSCSRPAVPPPVPMPGVAPSWPYLGKARVTTGHRAMVVSGSPIASEVGRKVLRRGGNAVDAAVAVGFALAVVHPEAGNIGGGGFMIIRTGGGQVRALDYRETAPSRASRDMYQGLADDASVTGHLSVGVPGAVAGLIEAHRRLGRLPFRDVIEPAIALARKGFEVDSYRSRSIGEDSARLVLFPASRTAFLPHDRPPEPGTKLKQPELAAVLAAIRDSGSAGFYSGRVADLLVAEMERGGGLITHADLEGYRAVWREPISLSYRGYTIYSMPPASSGGVTLGEILNIMEGFGPLPPFGSAALMHREAEAMRRAFTDRNRFLGDPAFVQNPISRLLSKTYAAALRGQIGERASVTPGAQPARSGSSTTHYSVIDAEGNSVSCTTTLNNSYGSAVTVTGGGFLLNDEMDDFATSPGAPNMYGLVQGEVNAIAPGKRMLSAMTPSIVLDPEQRLYMVVGTPGGPRIITMVYHVISNVIDHKMALPDAVVAPRMHHQGLPDSLQVEDDGFLPSTLDSLRARGHAVAGRGDWGDVEAIIRTPTGWEGVSDPRRGGGGAGY